jgi:proline dehydrogenase
MLDALSKSFFHALAASPTLKRMASRYGLRTPRSFARRFIAGEVIEEALAAVREIESRGMTHTLDQLGESVSTAEEAAAATSNYLGIVAAIEKAGVGRNISVKLTQLGLDVDRATCVDNLRRILDRAKAGEFFVRIDMENSPYTDVTLDIVETVWNMGYKSVGTVLQSCLKRSEGDMERLMASGIRVRLVKGAYKEPASVAYQSKSDVDAAFVRMAQALLARGNYPAIATHDPAMIAMIRDFVAQQNIAHDRFEFQLLFGIRRDLQAQLLADGYRVRIYVPYGPEWYPYFMRRLGEWPANVFWVAKGIVSDRG